MNKQKNSDNNFGMAAESQRQANDLEAYPDIHIISQPQPWRSYAPFLKGIGIVSNQAGRLCLSDEGIKFCKEPAKRHLAELIQDRFRLFGEVLELPVQSPATIEEVNKKLCEAYELNWVNLSNVRRVDFFHFIGEKFNLKASSVESMLSFLKVSGLIEEVGRNVYIATPAAKA